MPNMVTRQVQYTSEVTGASTLIKFKIREDRASPGVILYEPVSSNVCGGAAGFTPRAAIVQYSDGSTIRYPIPTVADIPGVLQFFNTDPDVVCIHMDGEKWNVVPGVGNDVSYTIPSGFSAKLSGVMTYLSDVTGTNLLIRAAIENNPAALAAVAVGCAEGIKTIDENGICSSTLSGFKARSFIMTAKNNTTNGKFVRKAPVADPGDLASCLAATGGVAPCIGYKGETIRNAHLYLA